MPKTADTFKIRPVKVHIPPDANAVFGMSHFIKTVEDLYEVLVQSGIALRFGIAFCEASGPRLIRWDGNDPDLIEMARKAAFDVGCGHTFFVYLREGFPVNVLNQIKNVPEVCRIFCATSNPLEILVAETKQGRGVIAVIDGQAPLGFEEPEHQKERRDFLRKIGYKR